nr:unnamed protein product [Spirometra erinaceieuropaei]
MWLPEARLYIAATARQLPRPAGQTRDSTAYTYEGGEVIDDALNKAEFTVSARRSWLANFTTWGRNNEKRNKNLSCPPSIRSTPQAARVSPLTLAAWNARSLSDNPRSNRPERSTALVVRDSLYYKRDIAAFGETRFSEEGQLKEVGAGYTFFWSRGPKAEQPDVGIVFST